jgi:hypothetical protein
MNKNLVVSKRKLPDLSLMLALNCVRNNTSLERLHRKGKISDKEMKEFMKGVVNNLYNTLFLLSTFEELLDFATDGKSVFVYPTNWDKPELSQALVFAIGMRSVNSPINEKEG